jgi:multidrug transporter EmrE-like cation transporter
MEPEGYFPIADAEADEPQAALKQNVRRLHMDAAWWGTLGLLFIAMALTMTGELLLKAGINEHGELNVSFSTLLPTAGQIFSNPKILGGFFFVFSGALFWLAVLSRWDLSLAYPLLSINYVLGILLSKLIFKEQVTWLQVFGGLVIILGVTLVSVGHPGSRAAG